MLTANNLKPQRLQRESAQTRTYVERRAFPTRRTGEDARHSIKG
jgi:hypothetical protein